jgi:hypothetical protein
MKSYLRHDASDIDVLMRSVSPHLVMSEERKLSWPLSDMARAYLVQRFLSKERIEELAEMRTKDRDLKAHLRQLVHRAIRDNDVDLQEGAKSDWILGRRVPRIKPVSLALRKKNGVFLIDGVDLTLFSPRSALAQVTKVTHTFWQYGRIKQMEIGANQHITRIGVVLNGAKNPSDAYRDAHDFAMHEFKPESELVVDAASDDDFSAFKYALAL